MLTSGNCGNTLDVLPEAKKLLEDPSRSRQQLRWFAVDGRFRHQRLDGKLSRFAQMRVADHAEQWFAPAIAVGVSIVLGYCVGQVTDWYLRTRASYIGRVLRRIQNFVKTWQFRT